MATFQFDMKDRLSETFQQNAERKCYGAAGALKKYLIKKMADIQTIPGNEEGKLINIDFYEYDGQIDAQITLPTINAAFPDPTYMMISTLDIHIQHPEEDEILSPKDLQRLSFVRNDFDNRSEGHSGEYQDVKTAEQAIKLIEEYICSEFKRAATVAKSECQIAQDAVQSALLELQRTSAKAAALETFSTFIDAQIPLKKIKQQPIRFEPQV